MGHYGGIREHNLQNTTEKPVDTSQFAKGVGCPWSFNESGPYLERTFDQSRFPNIKLA
jgi:hypothetical protein